MKKICIVTGTRAEYGLLKPLMERIQQDLDLELQIIVTGMHLSHEFGFTYREIEEDGFNINEKIEILLSSDTSTAVCKTMGLAMISFGEAYERMKPDMILLLGDRYEIFSAASAAMIARIPIAHLHGGEITEGLIDEAIRHSITKMSYLHFTSTEEYRLRVIQLGESPDRVFNVGAIGVENIKKLMLISQEELEESISFNFGKITALVTFHPVTLENSSSQEQFQNLLDALNEFEELKVIFTKANSDTDGRIINKMIDDYVERNKHKAKAFTSLGQLRYLSAMQYIDLVVGNSSSGIIEAPSFRKPTINIGDRQKGRLQAQSVINCKPVKQDIVKAIQLGLSQEFNNSLAEMINPYGEGNVSDNIIRIIKDFLFSGCINIKKNFYNLDVNKR